MSSQSSAWSTHQQTTAQVDGHPRRRLAVRRRTIGILGAALFGLLPLAPAALAAATLTITTPYPSVTVAPGAKVSLDLTIRTTDPQQATLALSGIPADWTATLHGGGFIVSSVQTEIPPVTGNGTPSGPIATARLDVTVPAKAANGTNKMTVRATAGSLTSDLVIEVKVEAQAAGTLDLKADISDLRGTSGSTYTFNLTLSNDTSEDLTYTASGRGPTGWQVDATIAGQSQAASAIVKSANTAGITLTVRPSASVAAGSYPIEATVKAGDRSVTTKLNIEITGSFSMTISTPDDRLNNHGTAGSQIDQPLVLRNSGTAELKNVTPNFTAPTGWKVTFDPTTVASVAANGTATLTAKIVPDNDAIAGDYIVTFRATTDQASATQDIRFTVETSPLWGLIGIALIVAVGGGLWWVFQRYGRR